MFKPVLRSQSQPSLGAQRGAEGCRAGVRQDEGGPAECSPCAAPSYGSTRQLLPRRSYKPSRVIRIRFASERNLLFRPLRTGPVIKIYECNST